MALIQCPDCGKEISDLAEVCIGCGRPMLSKGHKQSDIDNIPFESSSGQINERNPASEAKGSFIGLIVGFFLITALLIASVTGSRPQSIQETNPVGTSRPPSSEISQIGVSNVLTPADAALEMAINVSKNCQDFSLNMQITVHKRAIEELDNIKNTYPAYKVDLIASLTNEFKTKILVLEAELQKQEADLLKEAKLSSPQTEEEAEKMRIQLAKETKEREQKQQQLAARLKKLEKKFRVKKDEVNESDFLTHKTFPLYADSRSCICPYIGRSGYSRWLRIKIRYTANSWLFVEKLIFSIDGENVIKEFDRFEWKRDNDGGSIWEWIDLPGDIKLEELLEKIAKSKKTILRFVGHQYYKDVIISDADKKAILETIEYYKAS